MAKVERKIPEVWYSGSLVQQNHGESLDGHGILVWDKGKASPDEIDIQNSYGFYTLDVHGGKLPIPEDVPEKARLRIRSHNTPPNEVRRISKFARDLYDPIRLSKISEDEGILDDTEQAFKLSELSSVEYQSKLVEEYCSDNFAATRRQLDQIRKVNEDVNEAVGEKGNNKHFGSRWTPRKLEFSNLFNYGENNVVDFRKMSGIVGMFASNASGKSNLVDALMFAAFDESTRVDKTQDVLRNGADYLECRLELEIDGDVYVIHRRGELQSNGKIPVKVNFKRIEEDGTETNLNGKYRYYTNLEIQKYIGTPEDFVHTAFSVQNKNTPFIQKSQSKRKDLLARFVGLDVFEDLYKKAKSKSSKLNTLINDLKDADQVRQSIEDLEGKLRAKRKKIRDLKQKMKENKGRRSELVDELVSVHSEMQDVPDDVEPVPDLEKRLEKKQRQVELAEEKLQELESKKDKVEARLATMDVSGLEDAIEKAEKNKARSRKLESLKSKTESKRKWLSDKRSDLQHLLDHKGFDPDCEYCVERNLEDNKKIESLKASIERLEHDVEEIREKISNTESSIDSSAIEKAEKLKEKDKKKRKLESLKSKIENKLVSAKSDLKDTESKAQETKDKLEASRRVQAQMEKNKGLKSKARRLKSTIEEVEGRIDRLETKLTKTSNESNSFEQRKQDLAEKLQKIEDLSEQHQIYQWYIEAVRRDGVPYKVIKSFVPRLEEKINAVLSQVVDFGVLLDFDDRNINAVIVDETGNSRPIAAGSGMEKFMCSISIRTALSNLAMVPKPQFLIIDEGFGNLDSGSLSDIPQIFEYLKPSFDFVIIVSHVRFMRGEIDEMLEIRQSEPANVKFGL